MPTPKDKTYCFLFTDVEGSTRLWEQDPVRMSLALARHNEIMVHAIESQNGHVFKTVGDGFCAVFDTAPDALSAAIHAQQALAADPPPEARHIMPLKVRMGLHLGTAEEINGDYFGPSLNQVARLTATANGAQVVISAALAATLHSDPSLTLRDLGRRRLRDLAEPMHIYQVIIPGIQNSYVPIRTLSDRPSNLPVQLSSFVGREAEVEAVCRRLRQPAVRLLTLFGPGGIGKTRLSLRVAAVMRDEYEDGVFFVALSPITSDAGLIEAIAGALKLEESADQPLMENLKDYLTSRHLLLVMDNFEQVVESAPLLNELLSVAANLKMLVTSREELLIYGEQIYPLGPLSLPALGEIVPLSHMTRYAAISLFLERVRAINEDFELDENNASQVIEICRCLDGLPLAIELASVRVREYSLADILSQLSQRMTMLSRGARDLPARQRTIRGAIDWSYQLLPLAEQSAFMRLSVFIGPFTIEAADSVVGAEYLNRLKEKSLVQQLYDSQDEALYTMLQTLREYALNCLQEAGDEQALRGQHLAYYQDLVARAEPHLTGPEQMIWFRRLEQEQFNVQAALEWALQQAAYEPAAEMAAILWRFWGAHSRLSTGSHWTAQLLPHLDQLPPLLQGRLQHGAGRLAFLKGHYDESTALLLASKSLYEALGDAELLASVNLSLGDTAFLQGDLLLAEHYFHNSMTAYQQAGDMAGFGRCLAQLGRLAHEQSNLAGAASLLQESLMLTREYGSTESIAIAVNDLAEIFRMQGQYAEAAQLYQESLSLYRQLDFDFGVAVMLHNLAQVTRELGDAQAALRQLREAIGYLHNLEEKQVLMECFAALGAVYVRLQRYEAAITLLSAAQRLIGAEGLELSQSDDEVYQAHLLLARESSAPDLWDRSWAQGQARPLDRLVADILQEDA